MLKRLVKLVGCGIGLLVALFILLLIWTMATNDPEELKRISDEEYSNTKVTTEEKVVESETKTKANTTEKENQKNNEEDDKYEDEYAGYEDQFIFPGSSHRIIPDSEIENKTQEELRLGRNEIFARYHYIFESDDLNTYFRDEVEWYTPGSTKNGFDNSNIELNSIEKKNIENIKKFEDGSNNSNRIDSNYNNPEINETDVPTADYDFTVLNTIPSDGAKIKLFGTVTDKTESSVYLKLENGKIVKCVDAQVAESEYTISDYVDYDQELVVFGTYDAGGNASNGYCVDVEWLGTPAY